MRKVLFILFVILCFYNIEYINYNKYIIGVVITISYILFDMLKLKSLHYHIIIFVAYITNSIYIGQQVNIEMVYNILLLAPILNYKFTNYSNVSIYLVMFCIIVFYIPFFLSDNDIERMLSIGISIVFAFHSFKYYEELYNITDKGKNLLYFFKE